MNTKMLDSSAGNRQTVNCAKGRLAPGSSYKHVAHARPPNRLAAAGPLLRATRRATSLDAVAEDMVSTAVFDTTAALLLLGIALLGSYAPVFLHQRGGRSLAFALGNMLSAGVMISAGLVHLLGAAMQELDTVSVFPLAPFLCGLGYILTLLADHAATILTAQQGWELAHCGGPESNSMLSRNVNGRSHSRSDGYEDIEMGSPEGGASLRQASEASKQTPADPGDDQSEILIASGSDSKEAAHRVSPLKLRADSQDNGSHDERGPDTSDVPLGSEGPEGSGSPPLQSVGTPTAGEKARVLARSLSGSEGGRAQVSFVTAVLMAVALCFHSVLEGTAMGAQGSVVDSLHIFIAIMAHKGLAAYALGSSVLESGASKPRFWIVIGIFAAATPIGIGFGRVVASVAEGGPAAGLSALASGTFLYVAFMEVIPKELQSPEDGLSKLAILMLGFGLMSLLAIWA